MKSEKETSQVTSQLKSRILTNKKFGSLDLDEWLFEKLDIKKGYSVLDVGCGTGSLIIKLSELLPQGNYFGIDISKNSIEEAKKKALDKHLKINFICRDASDAASLQNNLFDLIMSIYALYYVKNPEELLSLLKTKLKKNGKISVMAPYKGNNLEWYSFLNKFMEMPPEIGFIADNFMDNIVIPFAEHNFKNMASFQFQNKVIIPSHKDLELYWKSNSYHKEEFDEEFEQYSADFFDKNENFQITKKALLVIMD